LSLTLPITRLAKKLHAENVEPIRPTHSVDVPNDLAYMAWTGITMLIPNMSEQTMSMTVKMAKPILVNPKGLTDDMMPMMTSD
jgi:hypothetical protein